MKEGSCAGSYLGEILNTKVSIEEIALNFKTHYNMERICNLSPNKINISIKFEGREKNLISIHSYERRGDDVECLIEFFF